MKKFSVIAGSIFGSAIAGFVWWRFFPEPVVPGWLVKLLVPVVNLIAPNEAHGGEELLLFLALWLYVLAAVTVMVGSICVIKGQNERARL